MQRHRTSASIIVFFSFVLLFVSYSIAQPVKIIQPEFEKKFVSAYNNSHVRSMNDLIKNNRLEVKPFVDKYISENIQFELQGDIEHASQKFEIAQKAAITFKNLFHEKSLVYAVSYLSSWSKEQKIQKMLADSLYDEGTRLRRKKATRDQAFDDYQQALTLYRVINDRRGEGKTLGGMGFIQWYKRESDGALAYFKKALTVRQSVDDRQLIGNSFSDIGSVYWYFLKDYDKALEYHLKAEQIRTEIEDEAGLGKTCDNIAYCYEDIGDIEMATTYYNKAIAAHQKVGDANREARSLYNCGILTRNTGKYFNSLNYFEQSLKIREKQRDRKKIGTVLNSIGTVYRRLGEYETAFKTYQRVLNIMNEIRDQRGTASALTNIGVVLGNLNRPETAAEYYQRSLDISQEINDQQGMSAALSNLGSVHFSLKNYVKAEEYLVKALQLSKDLHDKNKEIINLINMGNALNLQGKFNEASANYTTALEIAQEMNCPALMWPAFLGIGDNFERKGDSINALKNYSLALNTVEGIRASLQSSQYKASFFAEKCFAYEAVIHLLSKLHGREPTGGYESQAFLYAEKAKARVFLDLLAESLANLREGTDKKLINKQEDILNELTQTQHQLQISVSQNQNNANAINSLKLKMSELEREYAKLRDEISRKNPKYSEIKYPQPSTLEDIQTDVLDAETVVLEYSLGDNSSSLWVISNDSHQLYTLPSRKILQEKVEIVRFGLLNPEQSTPEFFSESGYNLYKVLIQPADSFIKGNTRLIVIPDGVLNYLPFETLLTEKIEKNSKLTYSQLPYLIKKNAISYGQSASVLHNLRIEKKQKDKNYEKQFLAFGDPIFEESEKFVSKAPNVDALSRAQKSFLTRLPYSSLEIQNIAKLFPAAQTDIYLRAEASEDQIKKADILKGYRYIHFATHGLINEANPDFSSIILTQDKDPREDGFLQAAEIFNLDLSADLVVLSACETGLGKMIRGEGMVGLTRAFMYAGSSSLLVSLWSVSDISTAQLMENFYQNLISNKLLKTEALRQAQLSMIIEGKYSHPFYWAPFVLIGDWM